MKHHGYLWLALNRTFVCLLLFIPVFLIAQPVMCEHLPSFKSKLKFWYPLSAERKGIEGVVLGKVLVAETGNPVKAEIIKRESPECWVFDNSVISALMNATYRPGRKNNVPVKRWLVVPVWFRLKDSSLQPWTAKIYPDNRSEKPYMKMPGKLPCFSILRVQESYGRTYVKVLDYRDFQVVKERRTHNPLLKLLKKPYYPSTAKLSGIEGIVFVKVSVNRNGIPKKAVIVEHDPFNCKVFDKSAIRVAMESEYYPARKDGRRVDGSVTISVPYFYVQKFAEPVYWEIKNVSNASL